MKYTYEIQKKALEHLVEKEPHNMETFKKLYEIELEGTYKAKISFSNILLSKVWTTDEKMELIKLYGYEDKLSNTMEGGVRNRDSAYMDYGFEGTIPIDLCIKNNNLSGLEALLKLGANISVSSVSYITEMEDSKLRYQAGKLIKDFFGDKENIKAVGSYMATPPNLCDSYFIGDWTEATSMKDIIHLGDIDLFNLFLPIVKNPNRLLRYAVGQGNIEITKLLISVGADVNYQESEYERDNGGIIYKTVIKTAIDNNDLEMIMFLHQNGADLDFVDRSERIKSIANHKGSLESLMQNQRANYRDIQNNLMLTATPLEYAINVGPASILGEDLVNAQYRTKRAKQDQKLKVKGRLEVVDYLYQNGATFGKDINYTDLICFCAVAKDIDSVRFYFEEAEKKGYKLDFSKIIPMIFNPTMRLPDNYAYPYIGKEISNPFLRLCKEYSEKLDNENHHHNIQLIIETMFRDVSRNPYRFNDYKELITKFTGLLTRETIEQMPMVFDTPMENIEYVLSLGYDINCPKKFDGFDRRVTHGELRDITHNIVMNRILNGLDIEEVQKLISLGANINYQSPDNGASALSIAMYQIPEYDFDEFLRYFDTDTREMKVDPEEFEKEVKKAILTLIDLSSSEVVKSEKVERGVYRAIKPGYSQIVYNEILEALSKKGFVVSDEYFTNSIKFLRERYSRGYMVNPQGYLRNLYNNFANSSIGINQCFPEIKKSKGISENVTDSNELFKLVITNLDRTFITAVDQIAEPEKVVWRNFSGIGNEFKNITAEMCASDILLSEIVRYVGNLSNNQVLALIDRYPLINLNSKWYDSNYNAQSILTLAMDLKDVDFCKELIKRGASIVCYDDNGHDITSEKFDKKYVEVFMQLNPEYNPDQEVDGLILEIGGNTGPKKELVMKSEKSNPNT